MDRRDVDVAVVEVDAGVVEVDRHTPSGTGDGVTSDVEMDRQMLDVEVDRRGVDVAVDRQVS